MLKTTDGDNYVFTVNPGGRAVLDSKVGKESERSELSIRDQIPFNTVIHQSYSVKVDGIPKTEDFIVIGQWHGEPKAKSTRGPWLALLLTKEGELMIRALYLKDGDSGPAKRVPLYTEKFVPNKWYDVKYEFKTGGKDVGFIDAWLDGKKVASYRGYVGFLDQSYAGYFKFGIYRPRPQPGGVTLTATYKNVNYEIIR
jgi:hypothetical protein